jgi:long-subunit acyl-CoA synthetase (AMP-forming)
LPGVQQACVFGEAKPWNVAVITLSQDFISQKSTDNTTLAGSIAALNEQLPDYARIGQWLISRDPFSVDNGQLTPNGRLKREAIWQSYQHNIEALYAEKEYL